MSTTTTQQNVSAEQQAVEQDLVDRALQSFDNCEDPRLKFLLQSLTKHIHDFIREVRLTEEEWNTAIDFLTDVGHMTDDKRQEFMILSDTLGASMQTIAVNNEAYNGATEATVFGPFFLDDAPEVEHGGDIAFGAEGQPAWIEGTVTDTDGKPIPNARIEVWECDEDGLYDVQYIDGRMAGRARLYSDENGHYNFWGLTPVPYPVPNDGPVGKMLRSANRTVMRAAHLHFMVTAPEKRTLVTHIFVKDDPQLEKGDAVFGVKDSLIKEFALQAASTATPNGRDLGDKEWTKARFDIVLAPADR